MRDFIIEVEGEIVAKDIKQYANNWVCAECSAPPETIEDDFDYDKTHHSVKGNLVLDKNKRAVPYAIYYAKKGIQVVDSADISAFDSGPGSAFAYYKDNINKLLQKVEYLLPEEIQSSLFNSLYIECFSILELFLSDYTLCLCFQSDVFFKRAITYINGKDKERRSCKEDHGVAPTINRKGKSLELKVRNYFTSTMVFHRFDEVKELFEALEITCPSTDTLKVMLYRRNNIVHRNAFANVDGMQKTNATKNDVLELVQASDTFVDCLMNNIVQL